MRTIAVDGIIPCRSHIDRAILNQDGQTVNHSPGFLGNDVLSRGVRMRFPAIDGSVVYFQHSECRKDSRGFHPAGAGTQDLIDWRRL